MGFQRAAQSLEATTIPLPGNRKRDFFLLHTMGSITTRRGGCFAAYA